MYPSGEVGLIDTIRSFTIERENFKHSQSESFATGIFRDWHKVKTNSLYNQSPKVFYNNKKWEICIQSQGMELDSKRQRWHLVDGNPVENLLNEATNVKCA